MPHHPPHIFLDDTWYMVTAATFQHSPLLHPDGHKQLLRDKLRILTGEFGMKLKAWVILDNHYHLLVKSQVGERLPDFFQRFHGRISYEINQRDDMHRRQVWHNYWDTCIRDEAGFWTRFNYIHNNPVKHGYVSRMEDWPYSSYRYYLRSKGADWLADAFRRYPIIDYTDDLD